MVNRLWVSGLVAAAFATSTNAVATPMLLSLEITRELATLYPNLDALPSRIYSFSIDLDRPSTFIGYDGGLTTWQGPKPYASFYAELVQGNYVRAAQPDPVEHNVGTWLSDGAARENVWGSGPTYGRFGYASRLSLNLLGWGDLIQVDGFWPTRLGPLTNLEVLLTPGAMWTVFDLGGETSRLFEARVSSLTQISSVPTPGSGSLVALALACAAAVQRYRFRPRLRGCSGFRGCRGTLTVKQENHVPTSEGKA